MTSKLKHIVDPDYTLVVTPAGRKRIHAGKKLSDVLRKYGDAVESFVQNMPARMYIRSGGNGDVYAHMGDYAVKEVKGQSTYRSVKRMHKIEALLRKSDAIHSFARTPEYYAIYTDRRNDGAREYLLMERVEAGMKVQDIIDGETELSEEIKRAVLDDYEKLTTFVDQNDSNRELFTDFHAGNVLVDFSKSGKSQSYTLVVIDQ